VDKVGGDSVTIISEGRRVKVKSSGGHYVDDAGNVYVKNDQGGFSKAQLTDNGFERVVPPEMTSTVSRPVVAKLSKYGKPAAQTSVQTTRQGGRSGVQAQSVVDDDIYIPPPRSGGSDASTGMNITPDRSKFGIPFGTWARAEIKRSVTNADKGEVEIILTETLWGKYRPLDSQTILYGKKSFNNGTNRLDIEITRGITPDEEEITLSATVYNDRKEFSGLSGVLIRDRGEEIKSMTQNAALRTAGAALKQMSPDGQLIGTAYDSATKDALKNERENIQQQQGAIIKVSPQRIYLRFDKTI